MTYSEESYEVLASRSGSPSHSGDAKRPLQLNSASTQIRIPVPVAPYEAWIAAVILRDDFHRASPSIWSDAERDALAIKEEALEEEDEEDEEGQSSSLQLQAKKKQKTLEARLILTSRFLSFLAGKIEAGKKGSSTHEFKVLESTWLYFNKNFLGDTIDVHKLVASLDVDVRSLVPGIQTPKLLTLAQQGGAELFALFGGQGSNEVGRRWSSTLSRKNGSNVFVLFSSLGLLQRAAESIRYLPTFGEAALGGLYETIGSFVGRSKRTRF
jgi:hypothetical protein